MNTEITEPFSPTVILMQIELKYALFVWIQNIVNTFLEIFLYYNLLWKQKGGQCYIVVIIIGIIT